MSKRIAIVIPCLDEEATIGQVIDDFRNELPQATMYVFDNGSSDGSVERARAHGAVVQFVPQRGKGRVVQALFDHVVADFHVMVDGDGTYPASHVHALLAPLFAGQADMVVGARLEQPSAESFRPFHKFGNRLVAGLVSTIWGTRLTDIMSGYRANTSDVAQSLPLTSIGFEIETEMTLQMLDKRMHIREVAVPYHSRPPGSVSKLRTFHDGARILFLIFRIFKDFKPLTFFGSLAIIFILIAAGVLTMLVSMPPSAGESYSFLMIVAAATCGMCALVSLNIGLLLHTMNWRLKEIFSVVRRTQVQRQIVFEESEEPGLRQ